MADIDTASRLSCASGCGRKFQFQYIDRIPQRDGGALILGNSVHDGLQTWWEFPDQMRTSPNSLLVCMQKAWDAGMPAPLHRRVLQEIELEQKLAALAEQITIDRPKIVNPRGTADFKNSNEYLEAQSAAQHTRNWLDANENQIRWSKSEPPLKTWLQMCRIAEQLQTEFGSIARPLLVEEPFMVELGGWVWRGRIDAYGFSDENGEIIPEVIDWKSGTQVSTDMELFYQGVLYHLALTQMGHPVELVRFRFLRLGQTVEIRVDPDKHYEMLFFEREQLEKTINQDGRFMPRYSFGCRNCDYAGLCEQTLGLRVVA